MHLARLDSKLNLHSFYLFSPELLASGKTEASLRLYCSVRLPTLYRLPLVEKLSPSAWPGPNTATSHGELLLVPHELLPASTVAESGRGTCTVLWGETSDTIGVHNDIQSIKSTSVLSEYCCHCTYRAAGGVVCDGEWCRKHSLDTGGVPLFHLKSHSLNAWRGEHKEQGGTALK